MQHPSSATYLLVFAIFLSLGMASCQNNSADNAGNQDTIETFMRPKEDNTGIKPDSMQVEMPQKDSLNNHTKDSVNK